MSGTRRLCKTRQKMLYPYLLDKTVWDLGCGSGALCAPDIRKTGAAFIVLLDKETIRLRKACGPHSIRSNVYFEDMSAIHPSEVPFISYPQNVNVRGLGAMTRQCDTVVYIGCNDGMTACGDRELWSHLLPMQPVAIHEGLVDTMIVYKRIERTRQFHTEEIGAVEAVTWCQEPLPVYEHMRGLMTEPIDCIVMRTQR